MEKKIILLNENINELDIDYCMIIQKETLDSSSFKIDYGKGKISFENVNIGNKTKKFKSIMDIVNFMVKNGWFYADAFAYRDYRSSYNIIKYIFKKETV